jgi:WD40 repeat protein
VHLAGARTGAAIGQNLVGEPPAGVSSLAATVDGAALAAGRVDGRIDIWDLSTGVRRPGLPPMDSGGSVSALAFAADGRLAAAAAGRLRVWTLDNPQAPRSVDLSTTNAQTSVLAFSPDAAMLGSGGSEGNLEAWPVAAGGSPSVRIYRGHTTAITSIAFSPDRRLIAAAAGNQKVLVWDVESARLIGEPLLASSLDGPVATLAFSPDTQALTAGDGQSLAAWRLDLSAATDPVRRACQIAHRNLSPDEWKNLALDAPFWTVGCPEWPV